MLCRGSSKQCFQHKGKSRSSLHANGGPVLGRRHKCETKLLSTWGKLCKFTHWLLPQRRVAWSPADPFLLPNIKANSSAMVVVRKVVWMVRAKFPAMLSKMMHLQIMPEARISGVLFQYLHWNHLCGRQTKQITQTFYIIFKVVVVHFEFLGFNLRVCCFAIRGTFRMISCVHVHEGGKRCRQPPVFTINRNVLPDSS